MSSQTIIKVVNKPSLYYEYIPSLKKQPQCRETDLSVHSYVTINYGNRQV